MEDTYALTMSGLLRKRHELTASIGALHNRLIAVVAEIDHIDAVIRIFDPGADLDEVDRRPPPMFTGARGELTRFILEALRAAKEPMLTTEVGKAVLATRGGDAADRRAVTAISKKVGHALLKAKNRGLVASEPSRPGGEMRWWLK